MSRTVSAGGGGTNTSLSVLVSIPEPAGMRDFVRAPDRGAVRSRRKSEGKGMALKHWYAVQVETGREKVAAAHIRQAAEGLAVSRTQLATAQAGQAFISNVVRVSESGSILFQDVGKSLSDVGASAGRARKIHGSDFGDADILRPAPPGYVWLLEECFVPQRLVPVSRRAGARGEPPKMEERALFPGYLVVVSPAPEILSSRVRRSHVFAHILGAGDVFTSLSDDEMTWLERFTHRGHRTVGMSTAYAVPGARVQVVDGPLVGCEALISHVDHRKKIARVRLTMCGREVEVELGLRVLRKHRLTGETQRVLSFD